ncbi:hypothetical protein J5N97_029030 [Dioscorea zingiberensis]|uniref:Pentatricopeptide repeat-containing protein n=1 Tax=Dioscorea zingiberensis TaxID=325984 RepID=A0A9D5C0H9_9LILI|nr:hypothetical protein J5N97_029030 [Dioscorea zingiberensis]
MKNEGVVTIATVLKAAGMVGNVLFGRWSHGFYLESERVEWDVYLGSVLVDMYAKCHSCDDAKKMFEQMSFRNVVTWSALIVGYVHCGRFNDAILVFQDMFVERFILNQVTGCRSNSEWYFSPLIEATDNWKASVARSGMGDNTSTLNDSEEATNIAPMYPQVYVSQSDAYMTMEKENAAEKAQSNALTIIPSIHRSKSLFQANNSMHSQQNLTLSRRLVSQHFKRSSSQ